VTGFDFVVGCYSFQLPSSLEQLTGPYVFHIGHQPETPANGRCILVAQQSHIGRRCIPFYVGAPFILRRLFHIRLGKRKNLIRYGNSSAFYCSVSGYLHSSFSFLLLKSC